MSKRKGKGKTSAYRGRRDPVPKTNRKRLLMAIGGGIVAVAVAVAVVVVAGLLLFGESRSAMPSLQPGETVAHGNGGYWINVTPDRLAEMLAREDFTLVDVATPYVGEIDGTDLYIPHNQLATRASELPQDKGAKILVYCRGGLQSAQAAQTLLDLGYTGVWNLDGGTDAWARTGRSLVQKSH